MKGKRRLIPLGQLTILCQRVSCHGVFCTCSAQIIEKRGIFFDGGGEREFLNGAM